MTKEEINQLSKELRLVTSQIKKEKDRAKLEILAKKQRYIYDTIRSILGDNVILFVKR